MTEPRSVLVVDDHPMFREGVRSLIERSGRYQVVGEAGTGTEAIAAALRLRPDLTTMDLTLPDMAGTEAIRGILQQWPEARILAVSMHAEFDFVAEAIRAGALGYLVKEAATESLVLGLDALDRGDLFLDGRTTRGVLERALSRPQPTAEDSQDEKYALLSAREQQVMRLVAEGLSSREVADRLHLSPKTVDNHRTNLMRKLGIHSRVELVRYAARLGLIDVEATPS